MERLWKNISHPRDERGRQVLIEKQFHAVSVI